MGKRLTIGFMTRAIRTSVGFNMWCGVKKKSQELGVDLITIDGNNLGRDGSQVFDLLNKKNVDGVLTWATNKIDDSALFYKEYLKGIPLVSITQPIYDFPFVKIDTYSIVKSAVEHLASVHNIKNIAFIKGEDNNATNEERFKAYKDGLNSAGLKYNDKLTVSTPNKELGILHEYIVEHQLDELIIKRNLKPGKDFKAIMTVSEKMALQIFDYFEKKGISVPDDVAIISYDNSVSGKFRKPKPTAIILPFQDQTALGLELLVKKINGENIPTENKVAAVLDFNESCGCSVSSSDLASRRLEYKMNLSNKRITKRDFNYQIKTIEEIKSSVHSKYIAHLKEKSVEASRAISTLIDPIKSYIFSFIDDIESGTMISHKELDKCVTLFIDSEVSVDYLQDLISIMREELIENSVDKEKIENIEREINIQRVLVSSSSNYYQGFIISQQDDLQEKLQQFTRILSGQQNIKGITEVLEKRIHLLGIENFHLVLFTEPIDKAGVEPLAEKSKYVFGMSKGKNLNIKETVFNTRDILPEDIKAKIGLDDMIIMPMTAFGKTSGYFIIKDGPMNMIVYSFLKDQMSNIVKVAYDREKLVEADQKSMQSLEDLKLKAEVITENSQSINNLINTISVSMEKISENVKLISTDVMNVVNESTTVVKYTDETSGIVGDLSNQAQEITSIINMISDVAEKTNVLSINARIEAARAGNSGKGFSVVASEIKNLSEQTNSSTGKIIDMIGDMQKGSDNSQQSMTQVQKVIQNIYNLTENINSKIEEHLEETRQISMQLNEASVGTEEIYSTISELANNN